LSDPSLRSERISSSSGKWRIKSPSNAVPTMASLRNHDQGPCSRKLPKSIICSYLSAHQFDMGIELGQIAGEIAVAPLQMGSALDRGFAATDQDRDREHGGGAHIRGMHDGGLGVQRLGRDENRLGSLLDACAELVQFGDI